MKAIGVIPPSRRSWSSVSRNTMLAGFIPRLLCGGSTSSTAERTKNRHDRRKAPIISFVGGALVRQPHLYEKDAHDFVGGAISVTSIVPPRAGAASLRSRDHKLTVSELLSVPVLRSCLFSHYSWLFCCSAAVVSRPTSSFS